MQLQEYLMGTSQIRCPKFCARCLLVSFLWIGTYAGVQGAALADHMCSDPDIKYSDHMQRLRGIAAELPAGEVDTSTLGCHGRNLFDKYLRYVCINNLHVIPLAHALLYGVLKDFLKYLLGTKKTAKSPAKQGIISSQASLFNNNFATVHVAFSARQCWTGNVAHLLLLS